MIERSLCRHCSHRVTRVISMEGFIVMQDDQILEQEEDLDGVDSFIHDACVLLSIDLDHIVYDCNKFDELKNKENYNNIIKNSDILD